MPFGNPATSPTMSKTVILAVPYMYGLDQCIEKNLRHHGFDVINLCYDDRDSYYPHLGSRLAALYHKKITKNQDYKKKLKFSRFQNEINRKLAALGGEKADFALCIRANIYPKAIIKKIREHSAFCINYQWDGVGRFPDIIDYLPYFDRCFVFDKNDVAKYPQHRFEAATNFYFDFPVETENGSNGLYFLGGYETNRAVDTKRFIEEARRLKLPLDFHIYCKDQRARKAFGTEGITYLNRSTVLSFEQNLQKVCGSRAVVDFVQFDHYGLSFRIFDALCFDKKLITNNQTVTGYDFYHPDNIFVWNGKNLDGLADFLNKPYVALDPEIKQYYSFGSWIQHAFAPAAALP